MREMKALCCGYVQAHLNFVYARSEGFVLRVCAGSSELLLLINVISTRIWWLAHNFSSQSVMCAGGSQGIVYIAQGIVYLHLAHFLFVLDQTSFPSEK